MEIGDRYKLLQFEGWLVFDQGNVAFWCRFVETCQKGGDYSPKFIRFLMSDGCKVGFWHAVWCGFNLSNFRVRQGGVSGLY